MEEGGRGTTRTMTAEETERRAMQTMADGSGERQEGRKCGAFQDSLREARFSENIMAEKRIFFPTLNMIKIQGEILLHTPVK